MTDDKKKLKYTKNIKIGDLPKQMRLEEVEKFELQIFGHKLKDLKVGEVKRMATELISSMESDRARLALLMQNIMRREK